MHTFPNPRQAIIVSLLVWGIVYISGKVEISIALAMIASMLVLLMHYLFCIASALYLKYGSVPGPSIITGSYVEDEGMASHDRD